MTLDTDLRIDLPLCSPLFLPGHEECGKSNDYVLRVAQD